LRKWIIWFWSAKSLWNETAVASEKTAKGAATEAHTIACDQKQAAAELGCDSDSEGKRRKR